MQESGWPKANRVLTPAIPEAYCLCTQSIGKRKVEKNKNWTGMITESLIVDIRSTFQEI